MKANVDNWLENLSPERREEIERIAVETGRQSDEHIQRVCSSFGYKHGNYWAMIAWIMLTLFVAIASTMGFALFEPTQEMTFQTKINVLFGIFSVSCLIITLLFFIYLKARYAFRVFGVLIIVLIVWQLLFGMIDPLLHAAINALLEM